MGGHRRLRLTSTKNYERKKLVSLPLQFYVEKLATRLEQLYFKFKHLVSPQGRTQDFPKGVLRPAIRGGAVRFRPDTKSGGGGGGGGGEGGPTPPRICSCPFTFTPRYLHSMFEFGIDLNLYTCRFRNVN